MQADWPELRLIKLDYFWLSVWIFLTQGSNPRRLHLLRWQAYSLPLSHLEASFTELGIEMIHSGKISVIPCVS